MRRYKEFAATLYSKESKPRLITAQVAMEIPFTIFLDGEEMVTLMATPEYLAELATGFLVYEGILSDYDDLVALELERDKYVARVTTARPGSVAHRVYGRRNIPSGCGGTTSGFYRAADLLKIRPVECKTTFEPEEVYRLSAYLNDASDLYRTTRGVHHASLYHREREIIRREDIGRHNAVDKIAGHCLINRISTNDTMLLVSGRTSSDIVLKCARLGIPVLVAKAAATDLAVELADKLGITLINQAKAGKFHVMTHCERIKQE